MKTPMTETERASLRETALLLVDRTDLLSEVVQLWKDYRNAYPGKKGPAAFIDYGAIEIEYIVKYAAQIADMGLDAMAGGPYAGDNMLRDLAALATRPLTHSDLFALASWLSMHPEAQPTVFAAAARAGFDPRKALKCSAA